MGISEQRVADAEETKHSREELTKRVKRDKERGYRTTAIAAKYGVSESTVLSLLAEDVEFKTPAEWCKELSVEILDPDGWRGGRYGRKSYLAEITKEEFLDRLQPSTVRDLPHVAQVIATHRKRSH